MNSETEYKRLLHADPDDGLRLFLVFMSAEDNAGSTLKENGIDFNTEEGREYFYGVALGTIASTSHFADNADVRDWFFNNGYRW